MLENDGEYRQSLTQSEDYILQAALRLLNAQQSIAAEIAFNADEYNEHPKSISSQTTSPYTSLIGAGVGAAAGGLLGSYGAIAGAIAGTAVAVYLATKSKKTSTNQSSKPTVNIINVNAFINIVKKICENIDDLMETYRVQVLKIKKTYESKEEATLQNTYSSLLDQVSNVIKICESSNETPSKLSAAIDMMAESLENYGLKYDNGRIVCE